MAVYTPLEEAALIEWLTARDVGALAAWRGIEAGIENSNFFVTTQDAGRDRHFVLTLFERLDVEHLSYDLSLMAHLAADGVPCPAPVPDRDGQLFAMLAGKHAALVTKLEGRSVMRPEAVHCSAIGTVLARLHEAGRGFSVRQANPRGLAWWLATADRVRDFLDADQRALLDAEIGEQRARWSVETAGLPRGPIHADLFRDNALFVDGAPDASPVLGGVIDLYFAGDDVWLLDLAICLNDWCVDLDTGALDASLGDALVGAYERHRTLTSAERTALPLVLRAAALRFWLSRIDDLHRPRPAQLLKPHDPTHFERLLRARRDEALAG